VPALVGHAYQLARLRALGSYRVNADTLKVPAPTTRITAHPEVGQYGVKVDVKTVALMDLALPRLEKSGTRHVARP